MPADAPADTLLYMIAGYTVIFGILLLYLVSLIVRARNLHRDEETLQELEKTDQNR
jgi:hypothetical protein